MTPAVPLVNTTSTRPPLAVMPALVRGWTQNLPRTNAFAAASELGTDRSRGSTERIMMLALVPWNAKALTPMAVVASFEAAAVAAAAPDGWRPTINFPMPLRLMYGFTSAKCRTGAATRSRRMADATCDPMCPEAGSAWPKTDLGANSLVWGAAGERPSLRPNMFPSAPISIGSPKEVPVPWRTMP